MREPGMPRCRELKPLAQVLTLALLKVRHKLCPAAPIQVTAKAHGRPRRMACRAAACCAGYRWVFRHRSWVCMDYRWQKSGKRLILPNLAQKMPPKCLGLRARNLPPFGAMARKTGPASFTLPLRQSRAP